jgi:protein-S-isoprenylcysteine O-methyltransferase Ste14
MEELIFKILFVLLWIFYIRLRVPFAKQYKLSEKITSLKLLSEKLLIAFLSLGLLLIPMLWVFTPYLDRFSLNMPLWLRLAGVGLSAYSLFYFYRVHKMLGSNWSPTLEIRKGHELIRTGPYKRVRHPMYLQIGLWTIAQFMMVSNQLAGSSGLICWMLLCIVRIPMEEKMMLETFGEDYKEYMKDTGRLFPKL